MVTVKGFPGPLYPPDAAEHGKTPSPDSPFAVACKRTLGRIGAGPWDPAGYDQTYSDAFAHGTGTWQDGGMAAVQAWARLDPTGWVGQKTFNFLRSVRVPQGRSHAGEMAMDAYSAQLVDQAYDAAHPPPPKSTVREAALKRLTGKLGVKESPAGSNLQMFGEWYGENGVPWCAISVTWAYELGATDVGKACPSFQTVKEAGANDRHDYVPWLVSDARNGRYGFSITSSPIPGDPVCYDWNRNGDFDHVGLFEAWTSPGTAFTAIEGNTSGSNNSNGGEVMRRTRSIYGQGTLFVRVAEP
jgi:hypothetical protein